MFIFPGGIGEQYDLKNSPIDIYKIMLKAYERCSMLSCSLEPDPNVHEARTTTGLVRGHAYSVTKVVLAKIDTGNKRGLFPLIRVRNPWGNEAEWKGPWSDGSKEWSYIPEVIFFFNFLRLNFFICLQNTFSLVSLSFSVNILNFFIRNKNYLIYLAPSF